MREFNAKDVFPENMDKEDIAITNDDKLNIDVLFVFSGRADATDKLELASPLGPTTGPTCSAGASGAMHLRSLLQMTFFTSLLLTVTTFI